MDSPEKKKVSTIKKKIIPLKYSAGLEGKNEALAFLPTLSQKASFGGREEHKFAFLLNELWPEARWNYGGGLRFEASLAKLASFYYKQLESLISVEEISSSLSCLWSLDWIKNRPLLSPDEIERVLKLYADTKISLIVELDNPYLSLEDMSDPLGYYYLVCLAKIPATRGPHAVAVSSDLLAHFIRQKFPQFLLHAALPKVIAEGGQGKLSYYTEQARHFHRVTIHPKDALNLSFMEQLPGDRDRWEIVVNDSCLLDCPVREAHLQAMDKQRRLAYDINALVASQECRIKAGCQRAPALHEENPRGAFLSDKELRALYDLGFRRFKFQSYALKNEISYLHNVLSFLWTRQPEHSAKVRFVKNSIVTQVDHAQAMKLPSGLNEFSFSRCD